MEINRIVVVPHAAADMYALVDDIAAYPQFLPWCAAADVHRDSDGDGEQVDATLHINYRGIRVAFATHNRHQPPAHIHMRLKSGPLSALTGDWRFADLDARRCRVEFNLHYAFKNRLLAGAFSALFGMIFERFVDHFVTRAKTLYGTAGRGKIEVELVHTDANTPAKQLFLADGATVADALAAGEIADAENVGVFGRRCAPTTALSAGDRVEIYRPLPNDPRDVRRRRIKNLRR